MKRDYSVFLFSFLALALLFSFTYFENHSPINGFIIYSGTLDSSGKDTYLRQNSDNNYGNTQTFIVGKAGNGIEYRGLLQFNLSSIPLGQTITNASIQVYVTSATQTQNITLKAYRITSQWDEGTGTVGSGAGWNNATSSAPWSEPGGDYSEEFASITLTNESAKWYNLPLTSLIRGWNNGTYSNYGIILISDAQNGNYTTFASSENSNSALAPTISVDYTENAPPTISNVSSDSSALNPKLPGQSVQFSVLWSDLESNPSQIFICNSTNISLSGCLGKTFCNTSLSSTNPAQCSYTILSADNRTTNFWAAVCDSGNCSASSNSTFYVNHLPAIRIIQPNGGETLNQSQGNYLIKFNVSDSDSDALTASIYYGQTKNSTTNAILSNISLASYCTDKDSTTSTQNNCSYSWDTTGLYGQYFLTIIVNDSFATSRNSSNSSFNVYSLIDNQAPQISSQSIDSGIYSGKTTNIYADISEPNLQRAWVSINTTPQTNITMTNTTATSFNAPFIAGSAKTYSFKVYAQDTVGNLNDSMPWQDFNVSKPNATTQEEQSPSTALPYNVIRISGKLNASDSPKNVYAYLNVPAGFVFLQNYSQNLFLGNFTENETKTATWFLSTPLTESSYTFNITYTDGYSNTWQSSNFTTTVTSSVGGGYLNTLSGYPETTVNKPYYAESSFTQSGTYVTPDSIKLSLYDSVGNLIAGPLDMQQKQTGIYNYTYNVPAGATAGLWQTVVNATKNSINYYSSQYWNLVGALFDVANITIVNSNVNSLDISVDTINKGQGSADLTLMWNLTRLDNNQLLDSGAETFAVSQTTLTKHYSPHTDYTGQVKITFLGRYSTTETAGAFKIFSITSSNETQVTPPATGGNAGGGGGGGAVVIQDKPLMNISIDKEIILTKNIEKTIILKITNTGNTELTNITINISGLDSYYTISPQKILSIKQGASAEFKINLTVPDFVGEKEFSVSVQSNELTQTLNSKITVLSMKDYFLGEIAKLYDRITLVNGKADENQKQSLNLCKKIVDTANDSIQKEEFINAQNSITEADKCIQNIEDEINNIKEIPFTGIKMADYWVWIITWALILILIIVLIVIVYIIYRKIGIASFMRNEGSTMPEEKPKLEKEFIDKKIKEIEDKLK